MSLVGFSSRHTKNQLLEANELCKRWFTLHSLLKVQTNRPMNQLYQTITTQEMKTIVKNKEVSNVLGNNVMNKKVHCYLRKY